MRERPHLVVWDGRFIDDRMKEVDVSADEIRAAVRQAGLMSLGDAQAVVLENDGAWSVMRREETPDLSALDGLDVPGYGVVEDGNGPRPEHGRGRREQQHTAQKAARPV